MTEPLLFLLLPLAAYLVGALPTTLVIGRWAGVDLREVGTRNMGAGNLTRTVGLGSGAAAAVIDGLKGLLPILICRRLGAPPAITVSSGVAAVVGHNWSVYLRGEGGRGLATSVGAVIGFAPILTAWTAGWAVTGWRIGGGLGGFLGWGMLPVFAVMLSQPSAVVGGSVALAALMIVRRVQGGPGRAKGPRAALERAIWDTDRPPELETVDEVALP